MGDVVYTTMTEGNLSTQFQAARIVDTCVAYRTRRLSRMMTRLYNDRLDSAGINVAEMNLLAAIAASGRVQPTDLVDAMEIEKSTMSRNLRRLELRGLVSSKPYPEGRGVLVTLTDSGEATLMDAIPLWRDAQRSASELLVGFMSATHEGGPE